jgi:hypothetical protein
MARNRAGAAQLHNSVACQLQLGGSFILHQNIDYSVLSVLLRCVGDSQKTPPSTTQKAKISKGKKISKRKNIPRFGPVMCIQYWVSI